MLDDITITALQSAMHGLSARQAAISDDISNVNTPFYRARNVEFEGSLRSALQNGEDPLAVAPTTVYSQVDGGLTGNNVDLDAETVASIQTELSFQLATRAAGDRFTLLRTAIKGA
jgi:flagellar basal-body rod protein FlgB